MVSSMICYFGLSNFAVAEDIVQDTFTAAVERWERDGQPDDPTAWLYRVCKNKAINHLRKKGSAVHNADEDDRNNKAEFPADFFLEHEIKDHQLRLLFACCDDRLSPKAQIMLILRNLCGLRVEEIANALLMNPEAVTKSLTRSKQTLSSGSTLNVPSLFESRDKLKVVHTAIYLLFMEGYSATAGDETIRRELCVEAMRMVKILLETNGLGDHDSNALMALMCFHSARFEARVTVEGELVELECQNRNEWDKELIRLGIHYLKAAHDTNETTRFIYEAAIASVHCIAEEFASTNWAVIAGLYDRLSEIQSTPFIDLNRAVAIFYSKGPGESLRALKQSNHQAWLRNYYLYHALMGKIHATLGDGLDAIRCYEKALSLSGLRAEQEFLKNKITALKVMMN
jgi:RNA polymerase sigma factor (sigma-70 family)